MPVHWTISHAKRLVVAVAKDEVTVADIEKYFAGITTDGAMSYRKIFEITHTPSVLTEANLRALGERVASDESFAQAQTFAAAASARRPLAIFRELHAARHWLDAQPLPEG